MPDPPAQRACYLTTARGPVFALLHPAARPCGIGVVLCAPFGNDDLCSYRSRREWAEQLAAAGHPTVRLDLPGTGNSAGDAHDDDLLEAWTDAIAAAAAWLREQSGCPRVAAVGIGLGGLLAYRAVALGAAIDDLALWATPARGRTFVRELHALARMEASAASATEPGEEAAESDGEMASAGFVLSAQTLAALEAVDLGQLPLPAPAGRRVLQLERDGIAPDARLRRALAATDVELTLAAGPGYGAMVTAPQRSQMPAEVVETVIAWLGHSAPAPVIAGPAPPAAAPTAPVASLSVDGAPIRETPITVALERGALFGVLSEPLDETAPICAVLLSAGAVRHIGPNRMWVELARRWAADGVPTLRVDLAGIGDADGEGYPMHEDGSFHATRFVDQVGAILDTLAARGLPQRFVLGGLCSGAYLAFHAAQRDERVAAALMVNPRTLFWSRRLDRVRDARDVRKIRRLETWRKLIRGDISRARRQEIWRGIAAAVSALPSELRERRRRGRAGDPLEDALDALERNATRLVAVFTAGEPLLEEMQRDGRLERIRRRSMRVECIPGALISHTLEPLPLQRAVAAVLDEEIAHELERAAPLAPQII
ncbi:MAG: hypothetical protein JWQ48_1119 [Conexibacter sp.]|nr:hypothetical protein [Conexibacter sp.]